VAEMKLILSLAEERVIGTIRVEVKKDKLVHRKDEHIQLTLT